MSEPNNTGHFSEWKRRLRDILINRRDEESFLDDLCFHGKCAVSDPIPDMPPMVPSVSIQGVGRLAFPLCEEQAATIKSTFEPLKEDSACWVISSSQVTIAESPKWNKVLDSVITTATGRMGLDPQVFRQWGMKLAFDQIVQYEIGGSACPWEAFANHADTVATLVIQLPSKFHGGGMSFEYEYPTIPLEQGIEISLSADSQDSFSYSAFFSSFTKHELQPILWGRRLCLVYRLVTTNQLDEGGFLLDKWMVPNSSLVCELPLQQLAAEWDSACPANIHAQACLLQGHYTQDSLAFDALNTQDADLVQLLQNVKDSKTGNPVFRLALLLMYKHEYLFNSKDNSFGTKLWVSAQGQRIALSNSSFDAYRLSHLILQVTHKTDLDHAAFWADCHDKTERHYSGTTLVQYAGEPAVYYRSMVVFWPVARDVEVLSNISYPLALDALGKLTPTNGLSKAVLVLDHAEARKVFDQTTKPGWNHPAVDTLAVLTKFGTDASPLVARAISLIERSCRLCDKGVANAVLSAVSDMCSEEVDEAVSNLIHASVADCAEIDWYKLHDASKYPDGKDRKQLLLNVYLLSSLDEAVKVLSKPEVAVRFMEAVSTHSELFPRAVDAAFKHAPEDILAKIVERLLWRGMDCTCTIRLCRERLRQVSRDLDNDGPSFTWNQPRAIFPKYEEHSQQVLRFLHGPDECTYISGFADPKDARVWGQLHFGGNLKDRIRLYHFSVEFEPFELDGGRVVVTLTKTKEVCLKEVKRKKKELKEERSRLLKALDQNNTKTEPPEKRQRHWFDNVVPDSTLW